MSTLDQVMWFVLSANAILILLVFGLLVYVHLWTKYDNWKNPVYPYCDINPRFHPAFAWAPDGTAWIGNVQIPTWRL